MSDTKISAVCLGMGREANQNRLLFAAMFALHVSDSKRIVEVKRLRHVGRMTPICSVSADFFSHLPLCPNRKPVKSLKPNLLMKL